VPELPEVETLRRQLQSALPGRVLVDAWFSPDAPKLLRGLTSEEFLLTVRGRTIGEVRRSGKWLIILFKEGLALVMHLRMTGRVLLRRPDAPEDPYLRARLALAGGDEIRWCDVRKFGTWDLVIDPAIVTGAMGHEPLGESFGAGKLVAAAAGRRAPIKSFLIDQRRIAGLGNIYADEALWDAGIHPLRAAGTITHTEAEGLCAAIVHVLLDSLESGGSSMRDYLDTAGRAGRFQERWQVYKREGSPCPRCSASIVRITVGGRGTRYCPQCQPEQSGSRD
jgi:formamidopyrimidine-DNA glycosylase